MSNRSVTQPRTAAVIFIFITVVLDILALGVIIPVLPKLVASFLNGDTHKAAQVYGVFGTVWALAQFLCSSLLGALSDRFGRRPVILLSNLGLGLDYVLMALAPSLGWLFVGRVISGITAASFTTASAYVADVTTPEKRAAGFGMLGAAFGLGFVLGPALGGVLGNVDPRLPFWVAGALSLLNAAYGFFVLPESLGTDKRAAFSWQRANPLIGLVFLAKHRQLLGLAAATMFYNLAHEVLPNVFVLYTNYRFKWNERTVGLTLAGVGVCSMIVQGGLVRHAVRYLGERKSMLTGLVFGALAFAMYGLADTQIWMWVGIPVMGIMGFYNAAAQSMMTQHVDAHEQGRLQGALNSLRGIMGIVGPGLFTQTFAYFIATDRRVQMPGAPFLLASLLLTASFAIALLATRQHRQREI